MKEPNKLSLFYFLAYSAFASWLTFFNVHLLKLGYNGLQIGMFNSLFIMVSAISVPFWGMMADKKGSYRTLLFLTGICTILLLFLANSVSYLSIAFFVIVLSLFQQPIGAVTDGIVLVLVKSRGDLSYGRLRLWGSVGWAFTALIVGYLALENTKNIFYTSSIIFALMFLINLVTLPPKPITGRSLVTFKSFGIFFRNSKLFIFFILMFLYGISISPLHLLINLYYKEIGGDNNIIGIAYLIQAGCEIPFFIFGAKMVKRTSAEFTLLLAMAVSMLRMVLYGFISDPFVAVFIGILHGFTIAFFLVGAVEYVQSHTPHHLRTTGQSLIWAFHFGAGLTVGYTLTGYLYDLIGMQQSMHIAAIFSLFILISTYFFLNKHNPFRFSGLK